MVEDTAALDVLRVWGHVVWVASGKVPDEDFEPVPICFPSVSEEGRAG